jgi:hypothetical protein
LAVTLSAMFLVPNSTLEIHEGRRTGETHG